MPKIYGQLQHAYNRTKNKSRNKKPDFYIKTALHPFIENFLVNKTKWKKMPKYFNGVEDSRFIASMIMCGPNKKLVEDIKRGIHEKDIFIYSHRDIIDAIVFIIQHLNIDVLTIEYSRDTNEEYKLIWDKISERGHA